MIPTLPVELTARAAFRAIMQLGGTIYDLTKEEVFKPEAAIENAEAFAREVVLIARKQVNEGEVAA